MEQAQYWMLMKNRQFLKYHFQVSMNSLSETWEEKAFAEEAAGSLGGCIWPPRSYSCSFCRREFKSAQALGGHMNVHRRDRAKLKQSLSPNNEVVFYQNQNPNPLRSTNPKFPHRADDLGHTFSASKVSALSKNLSTCSTVQGQHEGQLFGSDSTAKTTLSNVISSSFDDDEAINYKRRKIAVSTLPFLVSKEKYYSSLQWQVLEVKPAVAGSMEDLDLELRLGVQPKMK